MEFGTRPACGDGWANNSSTKSLSVCAHRDSLTIHLAHSEEPTTGASALYIHVDDVDQLAEDWRAAGVNVIGPDDYDYGKREGSHRDPDGNLLRFGSPLRRSPSSASVRR